MNWRVDVEIASRSVKTSAQPVYLLGIVRGNDRSSKVDALHLVSIYDS